MNYEDAYQTVKEFFNNPKKFKETSAELQKDLVDLLPALRFLYVSFRNGNLDNRSGEETYGIKNNSTWNEDLEYISDRWGCAFRVRWMIDLAESFDPKSS